MFFTPKQSTPDNPGNCAVTAKATDPVGFVHTAHYLAGWDPYVQVSVEGLKLLVAEIPRSVSPFATRDEVEQLEEKLAEAWSENARLRVVAALAKEEAAEANRAVEAVGVLKARGFTASKKPGPKPAKVV